MNDCNEGLRGCGGFGGGAELRAVVWMKWRSGEELKGFVFFGERGKLLFLTIPTLVVPEFCWIMQMGYTDWASLKSKGKFWRWKQWIYARLSIFVFVFFFFFYFACEVCIENKELRNFPSWLADPVKIHYGSIAVTMLILKMDWKYKFFFAHIVLWSLKPCQHFNTVKWSAFYNLKNKFKSAFPFERWSAAVLVLLSGYFR